MLSQFHTPSFSSKCAKAALRQRRMRLAVSGVAGLVLSLGILPSLQAGVDETGGTLVGKAAPHHGAPNRLLGYVGDEVGAAALSYKLLAQHRDSAEAVGAALVDAGSALAVNATEPAGAAADPEQTRQEGALAAVEQWARAWSARDVDGYLAAYSDEFEPGNGQTREAWMQSRRQRIAAKHSIRVELSNISVVPEGTDQLRVSFVQDYRADRYQELATPKSLLLTIEKDGWRIVAETSGS